MRTSTIWQLLGTLTVALALIVAVGFTSSRAQAQVDCERVEYNDRIVVRCDTSGVDTDGDGNGSVTSTDGGGDGSDGSDGSDDDAGEDNSDSNGGDDAAALDDEESLGEVSEDQALGLVQAFLEDEDAVAVNGVFEFDEGDRGGRRGIDDRRERAIAAAEAQAQLEADARADADAAAQAAAEAQAQVDEDRAAAEAAEEEAQAAADAAAEAAEAADAAGDEADESSEVASGASTGGIDDSGRSLWWLILALGLLALAFVGVLIARRRGEVYYDEDEQSWDEAPVARASMPSTNQGPPEGWAPPVAGSGIAAAPPVNAPQAEVPAGHLPGEHLAGEHLSVTETGSTPGPLANLFPPLPADNEARVENSAGAEAPVAESAGTEASVENSAGTEAPVAESAGAHREQAPPMPADAAMTETVRMNPAPIEHNHIAIPSDAEVAEIEVPIETASLEDLPPPPAPPEPAQAELPVREARDLPTRDPGSQLSAGAAAAAAAAEGVHDFHRLPGSLSAPPTADLGPEPVLPELGIDEMTQERPSE